MGEDWAVGGGEAQNPGLPSDSDGDDEELMRQVDQIMPLKPGLPKEDASQEEAPTAGDELKPGGEDWAVGGGEAQNPGLPSDSDGDDEELMRQVDEIMPPELGVPEEDASQEEAPTAGDELRSGGDDGDDGNCSDDGDGDPSETDGGTTEASARCTAPGGSDASADASADLQVAVYAEHEKEIEDMFLNENVAVSVAELLAEQTAWGNEVAELQVFGSLEHPNGLMDMIHAALLARADGTATVAQITKFCVCCRWLKDARPTPKVNSFATFHSETTFKTMLVQRCLNNTDHFVRVTGGPSVMYKRKDELPEGYEVPQTCLIALTPEMLSTRLWSELTQKALNDRSCRLASSLLDRQQHSEYRPEEQLVLGRGLVLSRAVKVLEYIMSIDGADVFHDPVDQTKFPEYYAVVKTPMDLGTISNNLKAAKYPKIEDFARDVRTTFRNCLLVNRTSSAIAQVARLLLAIFEQALQQFVLDQSLDLAILDDVWSAEICLTCQAGGDKESENMLLCDGCDGAYHIYCLDPPLKSIPSGNWYCKFCTGRRKTTFKACCTFCHYARIPLEVCRVDLEHFDTPWNEEPPIEIPKKVPVSKPKPDNSKKGQKRKAGKDDKPKRDPEGKRSKKTPTSIEPKEGVHYSLAEDGRLKCKACSKLYGSVMGLKGHFTKGCDGGVWKCEWCSCSYEEASGRSPGPNGPGTLCAACSSRHRSGHTGPPKRDAEGNFLCEACGAKFETIRGLGSHRRGCTGGKWQCEWCKCDETGTTGKAPGPKGAKTLCATCGSRFRAGHTKAVAKNADGKYECENCKKVFDSVVAVGGHKRFCDGGNWHCNWCNATSAETSSKSPGPDGAKTLCQACSARWKSGHTSAPQQDADGNYLCQACGAKFETIRGLGSHRRGCTGGKWRCEWCKCDETGTTGKAPGPNGAKTLCATCGSRFRSGHTKAIEKHDMGDGVQKYRCESCPATFDTVVALGGHRRYCDGGKWRCQWCDTTYLECRGKAPGPQGAKTLCAACGSRFRAGHIGPPKMDEDGMYVCNTCQKRFATIPALGGHRRYCDPTGKHDSQHNDDLELLSEILLSPYEEPEEEPAKDEAAKEEPAKQDSDVGTAGAAQDDPTTAPETAAITSKTTEAPARYQTKYLQPDAPAAADTTAGDAKPQEQAQSSTKTAENDVGGAKKTNSGLNGAPKPKKAGSYEVEDAMLLPPKTTPIGESMGINFDIASVVDFLHRFAEELDLGVPQLTSEQLHLLLTSRKALRGLRSDVLTQLHIRLVQLLMDDIDKVRDWEQYFFKTNLKVATDLLTAVTWPEILRMHTHRTLPGIPANRAVLEALHSVHVQGYDSITIEEKLIILNHLICEVLSTKKCYMLINDAQEQSENILRERMEAGMKKKRLANEKEAEKWIGKRVRLEDGTFGTVESGSRGVFRVKVDRPDDAKKETEEKSKKGKAGGICLRRAHEIKLVTAAPRLSVDSSSAGDSAAGETAAPDSSVSEGQEQTAQQKVKEEQDDQQEAPQDDDDDDEDIFKKYLEPTPEELEKKSLDDELLQTIATRTECLGEDRFYNTYWWFQSNPRRLYVREAHQVVVPLNVREFTKTDGTITERRAAAEAKVRAEFSEMPQSVLEDMLDAAEVDRTAATDKQALVDLITSPAVYTQAIQLKAVRRATVEETLESFSFATREVLAEALLAFGVEAKEEDEPVDLLQIIIEKKLSLRIDPLGHPNWTPVEGEMDYREADDDDQDEDDEDQYEDVIKELDEIDPETGKRKLGTVRERRFVLPPGPARDEQIEKDRKRREAAKEIEKSVRAVEMEELQGGIDTSLTQGVDLCPWCVEGSGKLFGHMGQHRRSMLSEEEKAGDVDLSVEQEPGEPTTLASSHGAKLEQPTGTDAGAQAEGSLPSSPSRSTAQEADNSTASGTGEVEQAVVTKTDPEDTEAAADDWAMAEASIDEPAAPEHDITSQHRKIPDTAYGRFTAFRGAEPSPCHESRWTYYDRSEDVEALMSYLNPHGPRERQLKENLELYKQQIIDAINGPRFNERAMVSADDRPPTTPPDAEALEQAKELMSNLREAQVINNAEMKSALMEWYKALLECNKWADLLPLVTKLGDMIDASAHLNPSFVKNQALGTAWHGWLTAWYAALGWPATRDGPSGPQLTFALYALKETSKNLPRANHKKGRSKSAGDSEKGPEGKRKKKASAKAAGASDGRKRSSSKAGSSASTAGSKKQKVHQGGSLPSAMQKRLEALMTALMNKENAALFATAVDPDLYPDYYQLIPEPMDFGTILEKVQVSSPTANGLCSLYSTRCLRVCRLTWLCLHASLSLSLSLYPCAW
eukprot:COSAG02_NODE_1276_length_13504_cov_15.182618_8_plen_2319_part_00